MGYWFHLECLISSKWWDKNGSTMHGGGGSGRQRSKMDGNGRNGGSRQNASPLSSSDFWCLKFVVYLLLISVLCASILIKFGAMDDDYELQRSVKD